MEEWRAVRGFEGLYEVSSLGRIRSLDRDILHHTGVFFLRRGRLLNPHINTKGYPQVTLSQQGHCKTMLVHRMMADAFLGPRPPGCVVRHRDGQHGHCVLDNLVYGTPLENSADAADHGTQCRGERHGSAKLSAAQVRAIREQRYAKSEKVLALEYGVSHQLVHKIHTRQLWGHLGD